MGVTKHELGGNRAYKQINGTVHQFYAHDELEIKKIQANLDNKARFLNALKPPNLGLSIVDTNDHKEQITRA